ncbi:PfkB family carbohydrate kinase [Fusobacterium sp.]|uniref:PfkB family carbohydrate kinase n=1 Tax=Fusobacterium sp. TaxID=68766 RepID=UPI0025C18838|nr:PfkB family carbohydrate kinase [Fusobacterium sp.]
MTIKEIAKLAGVSIATVSKIVNNKDESINRNTREKVLEIVKKYNYTPYGIIKQNSDTHSFLLAVIFSGWEIEKSIFHGIMDVAQKLGYTVMIYLSEESEEKELQHLTTIIKNRVDGVIWETVLQKSIENKKYLDEAGIKYLYLNSLIGRGYSINYDEGIYRATNELLKRGHKEILLVGEKIERIKFGFKRAFYDRDIIFNEELLVENFEELERKVAERKVTGIVIDDIEKARKVRKKLERLKYRIPADISIITLAGESESSSLSFLIKEDIKLGKIITKKLISLCEKKEFDEEFKEEFTLENENTLKYLTYNMDKKIVVVGSINLDTTLNVNELPIEENTIIIKNHTISLGGKGLNQTIGVSRMGVPVSLIGKVGDDLEGRSIFSQLMNEGIDITGIEKEENFETGKAYIQLQQDGKSTIAIFGGANEKLLPEDIEKHRQLFIGSGYCLISTEIPEISVIKAIEMAKEYGAKVVLKPSAQEKIEENLLKNIDIFILNRKEAEILCKDFNNIEEKGRFFLKRGVKNVIITLGEEGSYFINSEIEKWYPAINFPVVDTTGASDAFIATLSSYLVRDYPIEKAIGIATYSAGFSVLHQGSISGMIDRDSLETYIYKKEPYLLEK